MDKRSKREIVEAMLSKGDAMICLDSRYPEVQVPEIHKGKADLRLVLNLNFRHGIHTLPEGIQAELLFGGVPFLCWIPYESLWAVYNPGTGEGYLWPGQTPLSLGDLIAAELESKGKKGSTRRSAPAPSPKKSANRDAPSASGPEKTAVSPGKKAVHPEPLRSARPQTGDRKDRPRFRIIPGGRKG